MWWKSKILVFLALLIFCSCSGPGYRTDIRDGKVLVTMEETGEAFRNPMKGWREFFSPGIDRKRDGYPYPFGSMVKEYMQWNMMERNASDSVETVRAYSDHRWEGVEDENIKVIPRAFLVWIEPWHGGKAKDPDTPDDLNGWHWPDDLPGEVAPYKNVPGEWTCYLEEGDSLTRIDGGYFHPDFPSRVEKFVEKLGRAWDDDPRVAYVEMGIIGEWGEHHDPDISTFWPPHDEPRHVYGRTYIDGIEKVLGDAFQKAFKHKKVMVRYAYEFKDYDFGVYWDSWSIDQEIERGYGQMLKLGDRWKTQPIGGEITWNWGSLYLNGYRSLEDCLKNAGTFDLVLEQIRNLHCNHLGGVTWADWNDAEFMQKASELQKAMGYRYVIDEAEYDAQLVEGEPFKLRFTVRNTGSSPFYYDWPVEVALLDADTREVVEKKVIDDVRITEWMPGEDWNVEDGAYSVAPPRYTVEAEIVHSIRHRGKFIVALAVLDPAGMMPSLRFANTNYFTGGWTPLGYVSMGENLTSATIARRIFDAINSDKTLRYVYEK